MSNDRKFAISNIYFIFLDFILIIGSYLVSFFLRFYPELLKNLYYFKIANIIIQLFIYFTVFSIFKIYKIIWSYSNIKDIYRLTLANFTSGVIFFTYLFSYQKGVSRLMILLDFFFILCGSIFIRAIYRDYFSRRYGGFKKSKDREKNKILIIGAGEAGRNLIAEIIKRGEEDTVVGFLDDDPVKKGKLLNGKRVFGGLEKLVEVLDDFGINLIYIAIPSATSDQINHITNKIRTSYPDISIKIIPSILELSATIPLLHSLRDISIEDLLGREEFSVDTNAISHLYSDKVILVTGAGGSIGSEICKQLLKYDIKKLIAVGRGEFSIYELIKNLEDFQHKNSIKRDIIYKIANIKNLELFESIFEKYKPDIVFHAAAHKHVPLMEINEAEAIHNNIYGTKNILDLSIRHKVKRFILVSTDKAVNPVNVMGATKRAAELLTLYYNKKFHLNTAIVRFGNVLGSRGSVIPLFKQQIEKGGPITITHPEMVRYFMTIPEAAILMLNAAAYCENGDIFVLDMGKQYKILDIAKKLIQFYGLTPEKDIQIEFTGLRPGEKLYEELLSNKEQMIETLNKKIFRIDPKKITIDEESINLILQTEPSTLFKMSRDQLREWLKKVVVEYKNENGSQVNFENSKLVS
ncbi:MAG: polysaccharide biosynthesis protein [Exilispira sp.]|jgi:FlaA1/EpsC-like NDP-sugar epimerase|nr:polysaccharide biosynthesis protein [Exilispira sp.]